MIDLYDTATDKLIGTITEAELQFLKGVLEEEGEADRDYYFEQATLDLLTEDGRATDHLMQLLRKALGSAEGVEIRWQQR
jgi:hypothetical protein